MHRPEEDSITWDLMVTPHHNQEGESMIEREGGDRKRPEIAIERQTDRQTDKQTDIDRLTDIQRDKQDGQRQRERE